MLRIDVVDILRQLTHPLPAECHTSGHPIATSVSMSDTVPWLYNVYRREGFKNYFLEEAAGVDTTRTSVKLAQWRARKKDFLDKTGLDEDNIRHRVSGFRHRQESKAAAQAKKANKLAAENQYRKAHNTGAYAVLEERMSLKHVRSLVKDMDISLDGTKIKIIRDKTLIGDSRWMGYTYPDGSVIQLYPAAFSSREELVKTLGHEFTHLKQVRESGTIQSVEELTRREREAYDSEQHWWNEYRRKTGFDK